MRLQTPTWWAAVLALLLRAALPALGQGTFQNLGFEAATLVPVSANMVQFAPAFSGWSGTIEGQHQANALYNDAYLGTTVIGIIDPGWFGTAASNYLGAGVIEGNYTALLEAGLLVTPTGNYPADATLSQTAVVPATAQSLRFKTYYPYPVLPGFDLRVTLGGQQLALTPLGSGANYTLCGADIHTLAGRTAELDFTLPSMGSFGNTYAFLDSIQFSDKPIPEPSVLSLSALGALLLGRRLLGRRR
jgi:hypothetical protein